MTRRFDLYGSRELSAAQAADLLSTVLRVRFDQRDSAYLGEYYLSRGDAPEEIKVQGNVEDEDHILLEPDFPEFPTLVYVTDGIESVAETLSVVPELSLLRSETVD